MTLAIDTSLRSGQLMPGSRKPSWLFRDSACFSICPDHRLPDSSSLASNPRACLSNRILSKPRISTSRHIELQDCQKRAPSGPAVGIFSCLLLVSLEGGSARLAVGSSVGSNCPHEWVPTTQNFNLHSSGDISTHGGPSGKVQGCVAFWDTGQKKKGIGG